MATPRTLVVTIPGMIGEADLEPLRAVSDVTYVERDSVAEDELASLCQGYDYLMLNYDVVSPNGMFRLSAEFYQQGAVQSLKAIATDITGMDWASPRSAAENGVVLLNVPHYSTESVAESIVCEVLLHSRQRHRAYMDQIRGQEPRGRKGINLQGRTAGIIGLGSIGQRTAELLTALGMTVVGWNRTARQLPFSQVPLTELFETADVVCVCVKTVKEGADANINLVGEDLLARCQGAIIVNLANLALVDHEAMAAAIDAGRVTGYSVEWSDELRASSLGEHLDAVHFPPHDAWNSDESLDTLRATWVANVTAAIAGHPVNVYSD